MTRLRAYWLIIAGGLLLAACSGGDDGGDPAAPSAATSTGVAPDATAAATPTATPMSSPGPTPIPTVDPDAQDAGVRPEEIHLESGPPREQRAEDRDILTRIERVTLSAEELGGSYSQTRGEFRPNFRLLEAAADPLAMSDLILAAARVNGYVAQFDHPASGGAEQVNAFVDLFVNPTGASIAVKRAAEFVNAGEAAPLSELPDLGEQTTVIRFTFSHGVGYEAVFRQGRLMAGVLITYSNDPGSPAEAIELARRLEARLADEGL